MLVTDACCTLVPYFEVQDGQLAAFQTLGARFVEKTRSESGCINYAFSFNGHIAHCREGYENAAAVLAHLDNVGALLDEALKIAKIIRLEVHGPAEELEILKEPLAELNPEFFALLPGLRRAGEAAIPS